MAVTWFKVDDQFPRHPKVVRAGTDAAWLFIAGGCYCAQYLTDGLIPKDALVGLTALRAPARLAARLVDVGLWHDLGDEWEVHDYLVYNPSREQVEKERKAARTRRQNDGRRGGQRSADVRANVSSPDPTPPDVPTEHVERRKRPPPDFAPTDEHCAYALEHGLDVERERVGWLTHCEAKGTTYAKLNAGFSTWLHRAVEFGRGGPPIAVFGQNERQRCPLCADTGHFFDKAGELVECDHGRARV